MEKVRLRCSRRPGILDSTAFAAGNDGETSWATQGETQMSVASRSSQQGDFRSFYLAIIAGLACAFVIGKMLPSTMAAISAVIEPLCMSSDSAGSTQDVVEPISSHALPNVPGKRVTIVRVFYGPGGFTP